MRIGELAARSGLSVHAIRWYETQRLIPGVRRNAAGHREYTEWHAGWLALLDRLKTTGMSIAQMSAYTALARRGEGTLPAQLQMFVEHREKAAADIAARQRALDHIDQKIAFLQRWIRTGERPAIARQLQAPATRPAPTTQPAPTPRTARTARPPQTPPPAEAAPVARPASTRPGRRTAGPSGTAVARPSK